MTLRIEVTATGSVRVNAALLHLRAARQHAEACDVLEQQFEWPATERILGEHFARATGSVLSAACALEAALNEFYQDAVDGFGTEIGAADSARQELQDLWDTVERAPVMRRYQWVLSVSRVDRLLEGAEPYQSASDLIALRNALAHYRPEWYHDKHTSDRLEKRLIGKFAHNRLAPSSMMFLPYRALGAGCGRWAAASVVGFLEQFYANLGAKPKKLAMMRESLERRE